MIAQLLHNGFTAFGVVFILSVCGAALAWGDAWQRATGAAALAAWLASLLLLNRQDLINPQFGLMAVDCTMMVFLGLAAARTRAAWAVWAAAFQLLGVLSHLTIALDLRIRVLAYLTALAIWSFLVLGALLAGVVAHRRSPFAGARRGPGR